MVFFFTKDTCEELGIPFSGKSETAYKINVSDLIKKIKDSCSRHILEPFKGCVVTIARFSYVSEGGYQIIGFYDPASETFS
tara:strand:+ start:8654 stop:8896 length:243 start_codon:yes stop_codon:yes gene_type:complete